MKNNNTRQENTYAYKIPLFVVAKLLQSCPTLCDPVDCSPPGSSVREILQERILEGVAMPVSGNLPDPGIEPTSPVTSA